MKPLKIMLCVAFLAIALSLSKGVYAGPDTDPVIGVEGNTTFDFGKVHSRAPLIHVFKVTNPHAYPVQISLPPSGCGCTSATLSAASIPPHGSVNVTVKVVPEHDGNLSEGANIVTAYQGRQAETWVIITAKVITKPVKKSPAKHVVPKPKSVKK